MKLIISKFFIIFNFIFNKYFIPFWIDFLKFYSLLKEYFSLYKENLGTICLYILIFLLRILTDFFTFYYFPIFILYFFLNIIYFFLPNNLKNNILLKILKIDKLSKIINFFKSDNYFNNNIVDKQIILYSNPVQISSNSNNFLYKIFNILILFLSFLLIILLLFLGVILLFSPIFLVYLMPLIPNSNFFIPMTIEKSFFYPLIHFFFLKFYIIFFSKPKFSTFIYNSLIKLKFPNVITKYMYIVSSILCSFYFLLLLFIYPIIFICMLIYTFFLSLIRIDCFIYFFFSKFIFNNYIIIFHNNYIKDTNFWKKVEIFYIKHEYYILCTVFILFIILRPIFLPLRHN